MESNAITAIRESVSQLLKAVGIPCVPFLPERVSPPVAVVTGANPYISFEGTGLCEGDLNLQINLVAKYGANATETNDLDTLLMKAINALIDEGYAVTNVSAPSILTVNNANFLTVDLSISASITLGG